MRVSVCGYFSSRGVLVVVQNEIHWFIEATVGPTGGGGWADRRWGQSDRGRVSQKGFYQQRDSGKKGVCMCVCLLCAREQCQWKV